MPGSNTEFLSRYLLVVVGTVLFVASVAFVSIPWSLGGHPGETFGIASATTFHPT